MKVSRWFGDICVSCW